MTTIVYTCKVVYFEKALAAKVLAANRLLLHFGLPTKIVTLRKFYDGFTTKVVQNGQLAEKFNMPTGV